MRTQTIMMMMMMALIMLISLVFAQQGILMQFQVNKVESQFHDLQGKYWIMDKATRDGAATGSELNRQLVEIKNTPSELLRLKLVGVGKILTGIYILLFGMLIALIMMPIRLGKMIGKLMKK